jgi:hypothetical protein
VYLFVVKYEAEEKNAGTEHPSEILKKSRAHRNGDSARYGTASFDGHVYAVPSEDGGVF